VVLLCRELCPRVFFGEGLGIIFKEKPHSVFLVPFGNVIHSLFHFLLFLFLRALAQHGHSAGTVR